MHPASDIPADLRELLDPFREEPGGSAILSDIDGTLAPIVQRPEDAGVPEPTRRALSALADRYCLVACVTGRRAMQARKLVGLDNLVYIGIHGFERLTPEDSEALPNPRLEGNTENARAFVEVVAKQRIAEAGLRVEDKGSVQALHWRGAPDENYARLCAQEIGEEAASHDLVPHLGRKVLELRPPVPINKGTAMSVLLDEHPVRRCLYAGDDHTDVHVFLRLKAMVESGELESAVCIGIAADESPPEISELADFVADSPAEFVPVLEYLAA
jgi:trehalose 6-phosphate phosphatase